MYIDLYIHLSFIHLPVPIHLSIKDLMLKQEETPEDKIKGLEQKVNQLVEDSSMAASR